VHLEQTEKTNWRRERERGGGRERERESDEETFNSDAN
jgi:hypothetical protein